MKSKKFLIILAIICQLQINFANSVEVKESQTVVRFKRQGARSSTVDCGLGSGCVIGVRTKRQTTPEMWAEANAQANKGGRPPRNRRPRSSPRGRSRVSMPLDFIQTNFDTSFGESQVGASSDLNSQIVGSHQPSLISSLNYPRQPKNSVWSSYPLKDYSPAPAQNYVNSGQSSGASPDFSVYIAAPPKELYDDDSPQYLAPKQSQKPASYAQDSYAAAAPVTLKPVSVYSAPSTAAPVYQAPMTLPPVYEAPSTPSSLYGAPSTSSSVYGAPSSVYGAPSTPSSLYGAPSSVYGAPSTPAPLYGVPQPSYGPPSEEEYYETETQRRFAQLNSNYTAARNYLESPRIQRNPILRDTIVVREDGVTCDDVCDKDGAGYGLLGVCTGHYCKCSFTKDKEHERKKCRDGVFDPYSLMCDDPEDTILCSDDPKSLLPKTTPAPQHIYHYFLVPQQYYKQHHSFNYRNPFYQYYYTR